MKKDRIAGVVLATAGGLAAVDIRLMKVEVRLSVGDPGPKLFLYIAAFGMMVYEVGVLFFKVSGKKMPTPDRGQRGKFGFLFLVLICYLLGLKYLGFLVSTPLTTSALAYTLRQKKRINLAVAAAYSLIFTGVLYLVFVRLLSIVLP